MPGRARRRARRPAPLRRRRPRCASAGSPRRRSASSCAARRRRDRSGRSSRARRGDPRPHRGQRLPALRALAGARRDRTRSSMRRRRAPADAAAARDRNARERPRGRQPAPRAPRRRRRATCSSSPPSPGPSSSSTSYAVRRAARARAARRPRAGRAQRHDRGAAPPRSAYRFTHELVRRALYDRLSALRRAELHLRIAEALEAPSGTVGTRARRPRPPLRRGGADRRDRARAVEYNLLAAQSGVGGARLRRGRPRGCARRCELGLEDERQRAEILLELGTALFRAGRSLDVAARPSARRRRSRASSTTGELLARAAIGFETSCWRPGLADEGARELLEEASAALGESDSSCVSGCSRASPARSSSRAARTQAAVVRAEAIAMARRIDDRRGLAHVADGRLLGERDDDEPARRSLAMLERGARARRGARRRRGPGRGDASGASSALLALGDIEAARAELAVALRGRAAHAPALHAPRRRALPLGARAARGAPRRGRGGGRALARVGPLLIGRDASGIYGIQMFWVRREQGRLAELAPVIRILAAGERTGGAVATGPASRCSPSSAWRSARRRARSRLRGGPRRRYRSGLWLASLTYLADAASAVAHDAARRAALSAARPARRHQRDDRPRRRLLRRRRSLPGHARRDARRRRRCRAALRGGARSSTGGWARGRGSPTPPTSTGGCC